MIDGPTYYTRCYNDLTYDLHFVNYDCDSVVASVKEKLNMNLPISIYPNPATNKIQIEYKVNKNNKSASIILMDIQGNILYNIESENKLQLPALDVSYFANGMYIIKIIIGDGFIVKPVIVQHL